MADQPEKRFSFVSNAVPENTFTVVRFRGEEGLSRCYRFEIELAAQDAELDLESILRKPATFIIHRAEGDIPFHGILAEFRQLQQAGAYTFYQAILAPRLWWLSLTHHNQVFLDQTMPQIVESCLQDGGLMTDDFELRMQEIYPSWEYVCQYRESHLAFVSRWMERGGVYYYFEQGGAGEKVILTDTKVSHAAMPEGEVLRYRALAALEHFHREEVIWGFECRRHMIPQRLLLKDYNPNTPSLDLTAGAPVSPNGRGEWYLYGEHFLTPEEGEALARARAEELLCREQQFIGQSAVPFLRPGYTFRLEDHYREDFNIPFLTTHLVHEGSQAAYLLAGLGIPLAPGEEEPFYRNRFTAIPASVQFRPERVTENSRFYGLMNAKIDAAGSGQYAELDELGRYKVILPFDLSGRKDGKASAWLRMMQPYAGAGHGMHFPLHKGTEVLLAFIDGDPDRPVIAGAVPNPATPSPVTGDNQTMAVLQTSGKNKIAMEDKEGSQRILLQTPTADSWIRLGAPNDPTPTPTRPLPPTPTPTESSTATPTPTDDDGGDDKKPAGISVYSDGPLTCVGATANIQMMGEVCTFVLGTNQTIICGDDAYIRLLTFLDFTVGYAMEWKFNHSCGKNRSFEFSLDRQGFHAEKVDVQGAVKSLAGHVVNLAGQTHNLASDVNSLVGDALHMQVTVDNLAGQTRTLAESVNTINAQTNYATAAERTAVAERVATVAAQTQAIGEDMRDCVTTTSLSVDSTNVITESTDITSATTVLAGIMNLT